MAVALLALDRIGDVGPAAFLMAAWLIPHIVVAPMVGALGARVRRPARFYALVILGFALTIVVLFTIVGRVPLVVALLVAVIGGSGGPVVAGGLSSMVASMLPESAHARGYALDSATYNAASLTGPALAAGVATIASATAAGYLLAASAALGALLIAGVSASSAGQESVGLRSDLATGFVTVWRQPVLRAVTAATCLAYLGLGGLTVTAVMLAEQWNEAAQGGLLVTAFAVGATAGALLLARWPLPVSPQRLAGFSLLTTGIGLGLASLTSSFVLCLVLFLLAGIGDGPLLSATFQVRAAHTTPRTRAQVFTTGAALKLSAAALGAALVGALTLPATAFLLAIAVTQLAAALLLWVGLRGSVGSITKVARSETAV